jgi:kynurenine formamidase
MKLTFCIASTEYCIDSARPIDLSLPLTFSEPQANLFGAPLATVKTLRLGDFIGSTALHGPCNVSEHTIIPHCNGTHTESIGHITHPPRAIAEVLKAAFIPATLITIEPEKHNHSGELLISKAALEQKLIKIIDKNNFQALVLRTLPNDSDKKTRRYASSPSQTQPAYFSLEAMQYLVELGVQHLLVDLPSVDRLFDDGKLLGHHIFWNIPAGRHSLHAEAAIEKTITEMIFVPDEIVDGSYLLNLQIPAFQTDAAPSRPLLFRMEKS